MDYEEMIRRDKAEREFAKVLKKFMKTDAGKKIYAGWIETLKKEKYKCMARTGKGLKERCTRNVSTNKLHCKQHEKMFIKMARDGKDLNGLMKKR
jgi:hypothetical protein